VLSNLPRTRPQRATARREAARSTAANADHSESNGRVAAAEGAGQDGRAEPKAARAPAKPRKRATGSTTRRAGAAGANKGKAAKPGKAASRPASAAPEQETVPRQGFESEGDRLTGPVAPPGAAELLAGAGEALSEIARVGVSAGERVVRDLLSRLPGS
jgi:hypothetical protein